MIKSVHVDKVAIDFCILVFGAVLVHKGDCVGIECVADGSVFEQALGHRQRLPRVALKEWRVRIVVVIVRPQKLYFAALLIMPEGEGHSARCGLGSEYSDGGDGRR